MGRRLPRAPPPLVLGPGLSSTSPAKTNSCKLVIPSTVDCNCKSDRSLDILRKKYEEYLSSVTIKDGKDKTTGETKYRTINIAHDRAPNIEFIVKETPGQIIKAIVLKAHELRPDFLAIWNMNYDIPEMLKALKKDGIPPEDVFCDPCVPEQYRNVWYKEGKAQRETNSKKISQHPADLWHVLYVFLS